MNKDRQEATSNFFELDQERLDALYKEAQELSSEAEISLKEYFEYIISLRNRKSHSTGSQAITP